jgi:anti-sigma B factor antagonist
VSSGRADPPVFAVDVTTGDGGRTTVAVAGELDLVSADEFAGAVTAALAGGPVLLDLAALSFMDSAGVRALNAMLRTAAEAGNELRVRTDMQRNVHQVLELTGMLPLLALEERP